jgi:dihydroorotase-like cyclic amidohydrolase
MERLIDLVALNPQRIFGLHPDVGTYTLVDTDAHYVIDNAHLHTKCGWSPFAGMRVSGRVTGVWIRGARVYDGENVLVPAGFGRDLSTATVAA